MRKTLRCLTSALMLIAAVAQSSACVDVALVFAVDGSDSITDEEYGFQERAIASALRDRAVLSVLRDAGVVAVSAVFWGDSAYPVQTTGWFFVDKGIGAEQFARQIESNRRAVSGNTDIGNGIWWALDLFADPGVCPIKSIIDISGDGRETLGPMRPNLVSLYHARCRAKQMHVTINALVISDDGDDLGGYYAKKVIIGDNAFVMDITNLADFSAAIRKKLIKELSYEALTSGVTVAFATE